jgi:cytochrome c-type biogenesis protein CcmH
MWAAVAVAIGVGFALGAGALGGGKTKPLTLYQRTMEVAGEYRCPVCAGESVAASDAPEAVEVRALVQQWLEEGRSQAQVRSYLVKDYGTSILERPPASGVAVLVWALPAAAAAAGLLGLGLGLARWRRATLALALPAMADAKEAEEMAVPHQQALFELDPGGAARGPSITGTMKRAQGWSRRIGLVAGTALVVVAAALWLVDRSAAPRLPGGTITGGLNSTNVELQQAAALAATDPAAALRVYDGVLARQPDQPEALTDEAWIYAEGGFVDEALTRLAQTEKVDPSYDAAHLYRALVLLDDQDRPGPALAELKWYLGHGPAPTLVAIARAALLQAEAGKARA